jgi:Ca2+-binding RTX toxin-like protein
MSSTYTDFFSAIRARESSGDYGVVNSFGYLGAYQFGEAALVDLGFVVRDGASFDNVFSAGFTGKLGVHSRADFLASAAAQDAAATEWWSLLWNRVRHFDVEFYDQQTLNGITLTKSGMIAASHLLGTGALLDFIHSGGVREARDGYGTALTEYLTLFAGYETPASFLSNRGKDNQIAGGAGADWLKGFAGVDHLDGRGGNDILTGGLGRDVLTGGAGADKFVFHSPLQGGDVIRDFGPDDLVVLEGSAFGLGTFAGALAPGLFWQGKSNLVHDGSDHFVFRTTDDTLWFDANGLKPGGLRLIVDFGLGDFAGDVRFTASDLLIV